MAKKRNRSPASDPAGWDGPLRVVVACCLLVAATTRAQIPEQYPKPLIHTTTDHPAKRVLLVSIDGLHAYDLANEIALHPHSSLAELSSRGVTYSNAHTPWADPTAGLLAFTTGGTPISTGILNAEAYDRPGPHEHIHVNNIFEVVHENIGPTAWAGDTTASTDLLRGPSGKGLDDACIPATDEARLTAVLRWIDAHDCTGTHAAPVPILFGLSFDNFGATQATPGMGYSDAIGTPTPGLARSFAAIDTALTRIVTELKAHNLYDSTWIFITAPSGSARVTRRIPLKRLTAALPNALHISGGGTALIWLRNTAEAPAAIKTLEAKATALAIQTIYSGHRLALTLTPPGKDSRMPDIILQTQPGTVWSSSTDIASRGGLTDDDTHVALLVSGAQLTGRTDPTWVPTTQIGPLLLRALGLEKFDLQALHMEHTPALPGIF